VGDGYAGEVHGGDSSSGSRPTMGLDVGLGGWLFVVIRVVVVVLLRNVDLGGWLFVVIRVVVVLLRNICGGWLGRHLSGSWKLQDWKGPYWGLVGPPLVC
jgi:hypothetical protein